MKQYNLLIGIPCPETVKPEFAIDNLQVIVSQAKADPRLKNVYITYQKGVRTDKNRNLILNRAIENGEIDMILWLDVDMLYPLDIVSKYLDIVYKEDKLDPVLLGCLYFKRGDTFEPIVYLKHKKKDFKYTIVDPRKYSGKVVEVDALGFGGMLVTMPVYESMGEDKWCVYGEDFHKPNGVGNKLTHDMNFCRLAKEKYGAKVYCDMRIQPAHLGDLAVTMKTWLDNLKEPGRLTQSNINTKEYWDEKYKERSDEYTNKHKKQTDRWKLALEYISNGNRVLDIGCGIGEFLKYIDGERNDIMPYGVDISEYAIDECNNSMNGVFDVIDLDKAKRMQFNKLDVAFCGETLEHVNNPQNVIDLAHKSLKDGGLLVITTPYLNGIESPEHVNSFDETSIETLLKGKFKILKLEKIFDGRVMFVVGKRVRL